MLGATGTLLLDGAGVFKACQRWWGLAVVLLALKVCTGYDDCLVAFFGGGGCILRAVNHSKNHILILPERSDQRACSCAPMCPIGRISRERSRSWKICAFVSAPWAFQSTCRRNGGATPLNKPSC